MGDAYADSEASAIAGMSCAAFLCGLNTESRIVVIKKRTAGAISEQLLDSVSRRCYGECHYRSDKKNLDPIGSNHCAQKTAAALFTDYVVVITQMRNIIMAKIRGDVNIVKILQRIDSELPAQANYDPILTATAET